MMQPSQGSMSKVSLDGWNYYFRDKKSDKGVVVVHEIFGFDQYIASVTDDLANSGYSSIAVDLYKGKVAKNLDEGMRLRESVTKEQLDKCISNAVTILRNSGARKIGTLGFCMGGGFALQSACDLALDFCVDFYGLIQDENDVQRLKGSLLLILASRDERVTGWAIQKLLPAVVRYEKRVEVHVYPNTVHAFHRPNWEGHNKEAALDAWRNTIDFIETA